MLLSVARSQFRGWSVDADGFCDVLVAATSKPGRIGPHSGGNDRLRDTCGLNEKHSGTVFRSGGS
jgi:hypothetical protein